MKQKQKTCVTASFTERFRILEIYAAQTGVLIK